MRPVDATDSRLHVSKPSVTRQGSPREHVVEQLTTQEVAAMLRYSPRTVRWWAEIKRIPGFKVGKKDWRFERDEILAWLKLRRDADEA